MIERDVGVRRIQRRKVARTSARAVEGESAMPPKLAIHRSCNRVQLHIQMSKTASFLITVTFLIAIALVNIAMIAENDFPVLQTGVFVKACMSITALVVGILAFRFTSKAEIKDWTRGQMEKPNALVMFGFVGSIYQWLLQFSAVYYLSFAIFPTVVLMGGVWGALSLYQNQHLVAAGEADCKVVQAWQERYKIRLDAMCNDWPRAGVIGIRVGTLPKGEPPETIKVPVMKGPLGSFVIDRSAIKL
ncbi:hypothetical protein [Variovorax paradoxus]|uniref:hypothetical protein n=1 Tax=Variovorax paradoxus TaxID=34073 RepID=UPI003D6461E4